MCKPINDQDPHSVTIDDGNGWCSWIAKDDLEQRSGYSDVWRLRRQTNCTMSQNRGVRAKPKLIKTETIEESFDDKIVSQELKPRIVLKYF